jgi:hypothetical protein
MNYSMMTRRLISISGFITLLFLSSHGHTFSLHPEYLYELERGLERLVA